MSKIINAFPGYRFEDKLQSADGAKHNWYKGVDVGFGGYVYAEPGIYENVVVFDSASHHPHSLMAMNLFGEYTKNYKDLYDARIAIKHKDFESAKKMLNGKLAPYLNDPSQAKMLSQALKIALNSTYGLTAAEFDNPMRDPRNKNNIVALRGALFMVDLKEMIEKLGYKVISIKTDSIKVVNPPANMLDKINKYAKDYGYVFEIEHSFEKICLVNDAVFIAKCAKDDPETPGEWTATGTQFAVPYVFKSLFTKEPITFEDMCETKSVKTAIYLDQIETVPDGDHNYIFIGKVGQFTPVLPGAGGGMLMRQNDKGGYSSVTGTKGYLWMESNVVKSMGKEDYINKSYYRKLVDEAVKSINQFGNFDKFIS